MPEDLSRDKIIIPDTLRLEIPNLFQTGILSLNYISFIFVMHHIGIIQRLYNILVLNWNMIFPGVQSLQCPELCTVRNYDFISMQNDWLNLMIILAEKNRKKMLCSQRYLHFFEDFSLFVLPISLTTEHFCLIFFSKNDREIEPVVLHTINPMNSTKCVTTFSWIFHFSFIDFSRKIYETIFSQMGNALWVYGTIYKVKIGK